VEPEVIARGFAPEGAVAGDELLDEVRAHASRILDRLDADGVREHKLLQSHLHDELAELVWNRARKRPLVLPVVVDV
jgi:ribonuclease J